MRRRAREGVGVLSLDSFLDIVTNVVGVLILAAVVTVLGAGDIGVSAGASALSSPKPTARRFLFECARDQVFFVDEEASAERVKAALGVDQDASPVTAELIAQVLADKDVGDATHRVQAEALESGLAWKYVLRPGARGERKEALDSAASNFQRHLRHLPPGGFVYFVVHDDSFDVFQKAREVVRARGLAMGWHPVKGSAPLRLSSAGSLGRRVQ